MNTEYRHTQTTVSLINYHFVFCPRYRRKIFDIPGVEERFKELVLNKCEELNIHVLAMECHHDHAHLFLSCPPTIAPSEIMHSIKGYTGNIIRREFEKLRKMPNLWTRSYFVSTAGNVSSDKVQWYISTQKTRS